jgi:tetratricopeptide (TPR) repeat protein
MHLGDVDGAEPLISAARATITEKFAADSDKLIPVWRNLSSIELRRNKPADALAHADEALRLSRARYAGNDPEIAAALAQVAQCHASLKDLPKARATFKQALDVAEKSLGVDHPRTREIQAALDRLPAK